MAEGVEAIKLRDYQRETITAVHRAWRGEPRGTGSGPANRVAVVLPTGAGKGHPVHTEVPTPSGLRVWGDLRVGDEVFGADGKPTRVTAIFDRGLLPTYRVTMKHGESVLVDGDHLWQVQRKGRKSRVMSTAEIAAGALKDRDGWLWSVPVAGPVEYPDVELPLHPFVVGSLIANGGMTHTGTILTTPDAQVVQRCARYVKINPQPTYLFRTCPTYSLIGLTKATRELGMRVHSRDKRIPRNYLQASIQDRIELLEGLMIGDGSVRRGGRRSVLYHTTSPGLAGDVTELVTGLGGTCSIGKTDRSDDGKGIEFSLRILMPIDIDPFSTDRKTPESRPRKAFKPRSAIVSIEPAGVAPIRCITVEAPDSLYLITRWHIVTHNTVCFAHPDFRAPVIGPGSFNPRARMLVLVHRDELATQAVAKLRGIDPTASVGRVQNVWDETDRQVIVASVQTLARAGRREPIRDVRLIVVDEAHHAVAKTYVEILEHFGAFDSRRTPTVGFSATLTRSSEDEHLGDIWSEVVIRRDITDGIRGGWLCDVQGKQVKIDGLNLKDVRRTAGDFSEHELGEHLQAANAPEHVAAAYAELAADRSGVAFWPDVDTAEVGAAALREAGISAEVIVGTSHPRDRAAAFDRHRRGETQVLSSCMVLTEGWDAPWTSCAVIARPTQSSALYVQMAGRVLRPWHLPTRWGLKRDALLLDVVGVAGRHRLATLADLSITTRVVGEDETLGQAAEREQVERAEESLGGGSAPEAYADGMRVVRDIDLFEQSASLWLQTPAGTWFIPAGKWIVFLWPTPEGLWDIGVTGSYSRPGQATPVAQGLTMDWAMAQAEGFAARVVAAEGGGARLDVRKASWRTGATPATQAQRGMAARSGVHLPDGVTKAQASDMISAALATRALGG